MDGTRHPVRGVDYPRTFQEMDEWFRSDAGCREYIRRLRWPDGFACSHCGMVGEPWTMSDGLLRCRSCRGRTSLTAGTVFHDTRKPLRMWFLAMWFVTSQKNGVSALGLQRVLGAATRRPGPGSTSCVGRWSGLAAIASPAPSRSMKPTSNGAGKPRPRLLVRWR